MPKSNFNFINLLKKKQTFLLEVYGTLIVQLLVTFFVLYTLKDHPSNTLAKVSKQSLIIYFILSFGLILILALVPMPPIVKFLVFTLFAIVLGGLLYNGTIYVSKDLINQVLIGTIGIFIAMSILGVSLAAIGIDLGFLGIILLAALLGLIVASLVVLIVDKNKSDTIHKVILIIVLILFSMYIMYDTNIMLNKNYNEDFISAAIDLYLDIVNIFSSLVGLETN